MNLRKLNEEFRKFNETREPDEGELDNIFEAARILYGEYDKEYYTEEERDILYKAYEILRNYSTTTEIH